MAMALGLTLVVPIAASAQFIPKLEQVDTRDQSVIQTLLRNITIRPQ